MIKYLKENEFKQEVLDKKGLVVLDFYADWCGSCQKLGPVFDELESEMKDVTFIKVNVDDCSNLADEYEITNIPAILIFKDGSLQEKTVGFKPKVSMTELIKNFL
ncbi:thioredoxin [uncultured Clostridium sp.]|uniref:thioredoxin n=1 Tax=uncultured Clostridium sp. TaxID=59620 RepID=UPI00260DACD8|nr:thioredoxin [uncultured Clostridium sp.]